MMRANRCRLEFFNLFKTVPDHLGDFGIVKKRLRPGIEPRHLQRGGIEFNRRDVLGGLRRLDGGVPQAGSGVENMCP